ncbi:unnamed protein product, partial [Closterium sp. NIES-54]
PPETAETEPVPSAPGPPVPAVPPAAPAAPPGAPAPGARPAAPAPAPPPAAPAPPVAPVVPLVPPAAPAPVAPPAAPAPAAPPAALAPRAPPAAPAPVPPPAAPAPPVAPVAPAAPPAAPAPAATRPRRDRAAQQPSRPSRPAAEPPEPPEPPDLPEPPEPPEPPSCPAVVPLLHLPLCSGPTYSDWANGLSLFDLTSGASPAPPATADSTVRSQWATRDAAARLAVCRHLPTTERAHFSQYKSAQTLYDAVVARYSSPATAALSRLFLPYLLPDRAAFPTVADLIMHLRTSDTRYRAALPAEFCAKNPPPIYLTLYYVVTRLPDSLRIEPLVVTLAPLSLRGVPLPPSCPLLLLLLRPTSVVLSRSMLRLPLAGAAALAGARGAGALVGVAGAVEVVVEAVEGVGVVVEVVVEVEVSTAAAEAAAAMAAVVVAEAEEVAEAAETVVELVAELHRGVAPVVVSASSSSAAVRPPPPSSFVSVRGPALHLTDAWRHHFPDATEIPHWGDLSRAGVAIFDLDYDAILAAMYALSTSDEGDCYLCVPLDPGIEAATLGAGETAALGASVSAAPGHCAVRARSLRGGEFSSALLGAFCCAQGIRQTFTLPASPQQNGIAQRHIGMVMDVARTSMIHAAAPHFLWPFAVQYAAHQLNLQPRVSLPETSPILLWTGKVGDASAFRVWGSRAFVRNLSADKLSPRVTPCVFLGFPLDTPGWQFYHPTSRRVLSSQDVTFDESVPYYRLFPYRTAPLPLPPLFLAPGPPPVDPLPPQGRAPSGVSQVDAVEPVEVAVDSGAATGAEPAGAGSGGAESGVLEEQGMIEVEMSWVQVGKPIKIVPHIV